MTHVLLLGMLTVLIATLLTLTGWRYGNQIGTALRSLNQETRHLNTLTEACRKKEFVRAELDRISRQEQIARGLRRRAGYKAKKAHHA